MSMQMVGKENLPNVHIKEIELHRSSTKTMIKSNIHLYDFEQDGMMQWYNSDSLRRNIKIMVVASSSNTFNQQITSGNGFLTLKDISLTQGYSPIEVKYKTFSVAAINKQVFDNEEDGLFTFPYRCTLELSREAANISLFAVCFLDTQQYGLENSIDLQSLETRNYHGAIVGEIVLLNGEVPRKTNMLTTLDGTPHVGPVHQHVNGYYMDGSKHSEAPHSKLQLVTIKNTKVKDYSLPMVKKKRRQYKSKYRKTIVGDLWHSIDKDKLNGSFAIDMDNFLSQNSEYGYMLKSTNRELYERLLDTIHFNKVTIYKQRVKRSKMTNKIGSAKEVGKPSGPIETLIETKQDRDLGVLQTQNKYMLSVKGRNRMIHSNIKRPKLEGLPLFSSISEITDTMSKKANKRVFAFQDMFLDTRKIGNYQYSVEISFKDPAREYLEALMGQAKNRMAEFKNYRNRVLRRTNYNYHASSTTSTFAERTPDTTWTDIIQNFLQLYSLMYELDDERKSTVYENLALFLHPSTATANSIEWFYEKYAYLMLAYEKYFKVYNNSMNAELKLGYVNATNKNEYAKVFKTFPEIINLSEYDSSVSFIPKEILSKKDISSPFPVLTYSEIRKMANMEKSKFFHSQPTFSSQTMQMLSDREINSLNNIRYNSFTYFTPSSFMFKRKGNIDTSKIENIELSKFNEYISNHSQDYRPVENPRKQTKRIRQFITKQRNSFVIKPSIRERESTEEYKSANDVLGNDNSFTTNQETKRENKPQQLSKDVKNRFTSYNVLLEQDTKITKSYFNINNEESIMSNILNSRKSKSHKIKMIRDIPLQLKALIGSEYSFTKNNIFHSKQDLYSHPATKNLIQASFMTLVKLEYLSGYTYSCKPVWKELNEYTMNRHIARQRNTVLCRMRPVEDPNLKISSTLFETISIENEYFFISPSQDSITSDINKKLIGGAGLTEFGPEYSQIFQGANALPLTYTKTIVISQPTAKDGPLSMVDFGVANIEQPSRVITTAQQNNISNIGSPVSNRQTQEQPQPVTAPRPSTTGGSTGGSTSGGY